MHTTKQAPDGPGVLPSLWNESLLAIFSHTHCTNTSASEATSLKRAASSTNQHKAHLQKASSFFSEVIVKSLKFSRHWWHTLGNSDFGGAQGFLDLALSPYNFFSFLQVQDPFFLHSHVRVLLYEDVFLKQSGWWQNDLPLLSLVTPALGHGRFVHLSSAQLNHDSAHQAYFS